MLSYNVSQMWASMVGYSRFNQLVKFCKGTRTYVQCTLCIRIDIVILINTTFLVTIKTAF